MALAGPSDLVQTGGACGAGRAWTGFMTDLTLAGPARRPRRDLTLAGPARARAFDEFDIAAGPGPARRPQFEGQHFDIFDILTFFESFSFSLLFLGKDYLMINRTLRFSLIIVVNLLF